MSLRSPPLAAPARLWLQEALSAAGLPADAGPDALAMQAEGRAMRDTLAADLATLPGLQTVLALGPDEAPRPGGEAPPAAVSPLARLREAAARHDAVWAIAPECGGELLAWAEAVAAAGRARWIGPRPEAIRRASSKGLTLAAWAAAGLETPAPDQAAADAPWIVKPEDGAGGLFTHRHPDRAAAEAEAARRRAAGEAVRVEPWIAGEALSFSLRVPPDGGAPELLACNRQRLHWRPADGLAVAELGPVDSGALDADPRRPAWAAWAARAVAALPGLAGFVGIDAVLSPQRGLVGLELNPRLTSAYVGLPPARRRALLRAVLADFGLGPDALAGARPPVAAGVAC